MDDKQHIHHCLLFGCHVTDSDVAPEMRMRKMKEGGDRQLTYCGQRQCHVLSPSGDTLLSLHHPGLVVNGGGWEEGLWNVDCTLWA